MSEPAFLASRKQTVKKKKLTYWSQIDSSPGEIQYPQDISGNHLFRHVHGILRRP